MTGVVISVPSPSEYPDFKAKTPYDLFARTLEFLSDLGLNLDFVKVYSIKGYLGPTGLPIKKSSIKKAGIAYGKKNASVHLPSLTKFLSSIVSIIALMRAGDCFGQRNPSARRHYMNQHFIIVDMDDFRRIKQVKSDFF
jgi:hypothetical protein